MNQSDKLLVIAQCTQEKRDGTHPAKELYMPSNLFKAQRHYAEAFADEWLILSAKHGLVAPDTEILSYDETFDEAYHPTDVEQEVKDEFFKRMAQQSFLFKVSQQVDDVDISGVDWRVELICGEKYASRVEWYLEEYGIPYTKPFEGLRYGERIKAMNQAANEMENRALTDYA